MTLEEITALEDSWHGRVQVAEPERYFGWEPAAPGRFLELLELCLPHVPPGNRTFIDAGCGIGTKCILAARVGLAAYGIDRVPEYVAEARQLGVACEQGLIEDYTGLGGFGLVYVNHPLACGPGCDLEASLEDYVHQQMAPGAVLMKLNYDLAPGCTVHPQDQPCTDTCPHAAAGWPQITRLGAWDAAWVKPGG